MSSLSRSALRALPGSLAVAALTTLAACGDSPTASSRASESLSIVPAAGSSSLVGLDGKTLSLAPGDSARLTGVLNDGRGGSQPTSGVTWSSSDPAVADVDATGLLRARANGTTTLVARTTRYADTLRVIVSVCGTSRLLELQPGQVATFGANEGGDVCTLGGVGGAEFAVIPYVVGDTAARKVAFDVTASGAGGTPALATLSADVERSLAASASLAPTGASLQVAELPRDEGFERTLRARERRDLTGMMDDARESRRISRLRAGLEPGAATYSIAPIVPKVGDVMTLNTAQSSCTVRATDRRGGRVVAVSDRAVVVADTLNPAGGFTDDEYRAFAAAFDTLAYPVDVANFGQPTDIDNNGGRAVIFFTSAVNALTPRGATFYVGGFFYSRDLFPNADPKNKDYCAGSNNAEMFYMLVPDPNGAVNGNRRTKQFVADVTVGTLGHELQHLINAGRRLYVTDAPGWEDDWLNEGLSHVAEELMFYRAGAGAPRSGYGPTALRATTVMLDAFNAYQKANMNRLSSYLRAPELSSPFADNDDLETRGAAWEFLRYAADRVNGRDADLWSRLVNTKLHGQANLRAALGGANLDEWLRDWAVANYIDGLATGLDGRFINRSWSFRPLLASLSSRDSYPLSTRTLVENQPVSLSLGAGSTAYLRYAVQPGKLASIRVRNAGASVAATVRVSVVRVK